MKLGLDRYADLNSPIHDWEQRSKMVALLALIFAFAFVQQLILLLPMLLVTGILFALSKLPLPFLLKRLRYPGLFIVAVIILLPFATGGTVLFEFGGVQVTQEGLEAVVLIVTRFFCILTVSLVLFGTAPFLISLKALRSLRLPGVIVDMMLLTYRYLEEFGETRTTMERAMQLRGFNRRRFHPRIFNLLSGLMGSLLVYSYERSERVYQAMILRGYGTGTWNNSRSEFAEDLSEANSTSKVAFWLTLLIASGFIGAELFL